MLFDDDQSYTAFKSSCKLSQSVKSHTPEYSLVVVGFEGVEGYWVKSITGLSQKLRGPKSNT